MRYEPQAPRKINYSVSWDVIGKMQIEWVNCYPEIYRNTHKFTFRDDEGNEIISISDKGDFALSISEVITQFTHKIAFAFEYEKSKICSESEYCEIFTVKHVKAFKNHSGFGTVKDISVYYTDEATSSNFSIEVPGEWFNYDAEKRGHKHVLKQKLSWKETCAFKQINGDNAVYTTPKCKTETKKEHFPQD